MCAWPCRSCGQEYPNTDRHTPLSSLVDHNDVGGLIVHPQFKPPSSNIVSPTFLLCLSFDFLLSTKASTIGETVKLSGSCYSALPCKPAMPSK